MKNRSFNSAKKAAKRIFNNKDEIKKVFNDSNKKLEDNKKSMGSTLIENVKLLRSMIAASMSGRFKFSKRTIIYIVGGLIYFLNPFDIIPDFILGLGFLDDAAVLGFVIKKIRSEIERFKEENTFEDIEVLS